MNRNSDRRRSRTFRSSEDFKRGNVPGVVPKRDVTRIKTRTNSLVRASTRLTVVNSDSQWDRKECAKEEAVTDNPQVSTTTTISLDTTKSVKFKRGASLECWSEAPGDKKGQRFVVAQGLRRTPKTARKKLKNAHSERFLHMREAMNNEDREKSSAEFEEEYRHRCSIFEKFDPNEDGSGSLDEASLVDLLDEELIKMSLQDVSHLIQMCDSNSNGMIEWSEFQFFLWRAKRRMALRQWFQTVTLQHSGFLNALFDEFDSSGQGALNVDDMFQMCRFLKQGLSMAEVQWLVLQMDADGNGTIERDELAFFFDEIKTRDELRAQIKRTAAAGGNTTQFLETVFQKFDMGNKGKLTARDLFAITQFLKLDIGQKSIENLLDVIDLDKNGTIELEEFLEFFSTVRQWSELRSQMMEFDLARIRMRKLIRVIFCITTVSAVMSLTLSSINNDRSVLVVGIVCAIASLFIGISFIGFQKVTMSVKHVFFDCTWRKIFFINAIALWVTIATGIMMLVDEKLHSEVMPVLILSSIIVFILSLCMANKVAHEKADTMPVALSHIKQQFSKSLQGGHFPDDENF